MNRISVAGANPHLSTGGWRPGSLGALAAAAALARCAPSRHVVLVHGAFMGGWAWDAVASQLRQAGELVTVVNLPCHDPGTSSMEGATLDAYVDRVGQAVDAEPLPAVLVGHSMGGMVISQYAERSPEKVQRLIYLAAYLPSDGQNLVDLAFSDTGSQILGAAEIDQETGRVSLARDALQPILCGDCTPEEAKVLRDRYHDEPLLPMATPVHLSAERFGAVPKAYVFTEGDQTITPELQHRMADAVTLAGAVTLDTSHTPQLSAPGKLAAALQHLLP
ncbi:MAG TPA: alpha/beta hydrolase [Myxococcaceae bacterium]|nr:alpha/beta hydrolase [Myxococcaceae bacterium]